MRRRLRRHAALALLASLVLAAGCGGDDDDNGSGGGGGESGTAAQLEQADAAVKKNDFDGAIEILEGLGGNPEARKKLEEVRLEAAKETLASARRKLEKAPRAAMSQAHTVIEKYHDSPEARAVLKEATRLHAIFKRKQQAKGNF
jgi:outer membrane PBP1 activator LpoA protein